MKNNHSATAGQRNHTLDVLKGISILFVVITHLKWDNNQRLMFAFPFWIDMAIPVFILITGYVNSLSYEKKGISSIRQAYRPRDLLVRFLRYTVPLIPVFILVEAVKAASPDRQFSLTGMLREFVLGNYGPGSFYYLLLLQIIVIMPVIWYLIRKYREKGLIITFSVNLLYEILKNVIGLNDGIYRIIVLRHLFNLSLGCWFFYAAKLKKQYYILPALAGAAFIVLYNYTGYQPVVVTLWKTTCMFAVLWITPLVKWLIEKNRLKNSVLELMGRASYNIFLVQMAFFSLGSALLYERVQSPVLQLAISILFCCAVGILYYYIETPVTKWIVSKVKKA